MDCLTFPRPDKTEMFITIVLTKEGIDINLEGARDYAKRGLEQKLKEDGYLPVGEPVEELIQIQGWWADKLRWLSPDYPVRDEDIVCYKYAWRQKGVTPLNPADYIKDAVWK